MPWYSFQVGGTDPLDPNQYGPPLGVPPACPSPKNFLCAIQTNDNGGHPIITAAICAEIIMALQNRTESTNVKLRPTK